MRNHVVVALGLLAASGGCTLFLSGDTPCDTNADCNENAGLICSQGFCAAAPGNLGEGEGIAGEGEGAEGEGAGAGEGEGAAAGEGEGAGAGEGEGAGAGEGEGAAAGEGEGAAAGEGEGAAAGEGEGAAAGEGEGEGEGGGPTTVTLCGTQHVVPPWFDTSFHFRVPFAFCDTAAPDEDVSGLPVTVSLVASSFPELDQIAATGVDVIFVDGRSLTSLPYERQLYVDNVSGVWNVRVPAFNPHTGRDDVWMYFNSTNATDRSNAAAAFPDYSSVWHLDDTTSIFDARTGVVPANSIGQGGANITSTGGFIGNAIAFHGVNGSTGGSFAFLQPFNGGNGQLVTPPTPPPSQAASYSLLANPTAFSSGGENGEFTMMLSDLGTQASACVDGVSICTLFFNDGSFQVFVPGLPGLVSSGAGVVPLNQFKHQSLSWSSAGVQGTFDGNLVINSANPSQANFQIGNIILGMAEQNNNGPFNGTIDEVRISNGPRTASFYRAESKAYAGGLLQRGVVEAE